MTLDAEREQEITGEIRGMARGGALNLAGAVFNQAATFGVLLVLTRALGRSEVGVYSQALAVITLLSLLSLGGLRAALTRFVAVHRADEDAAAMQGTVRLATGLSVGVAVFVGALLVVFAAQVASGVFDEPHLTVPLRYAGLALPAMVLMDTALSATQGFKTMRWFALISLVFEPAFRLTATAVLVAAGAGVAGAMAALLASHAVAAVLAIVVLRRMLRPWRSPVPRYRPRELLAFSTATWTSSLASTGLIWAGVVFLGIYRTSAEVGTYHAATRLVTLAAFVMLPINQAFAPRIADLTRRGRRTALRRTYAVATSWIVRLSLPAFVLLFVFPDELLQVFGAGFTAAATVTLVLAAGKLVDAATGPCGMILTMSGRPLLNAADLLVGLALNVVLNVMLIPRHGILGSAVAWAVSLAVINLARVIQVRMIFGLLPFDAGTGKGVIAATAAVTAALAARGWLASPEAAVVGALAVAVVYVAMLLLLGFTEEDRSVLRMLVNTGRRRTGMSAPTP